MLRTEWRSWETYFVGSFSDNPELLHKCREKNKVVLLLNTDVSQPWRLTLGSVRKIAFISINSTISLENDFFFNLAHIFYFLLEMETLGHGWSVLLGRSTLCQWWIEKWQPRNTPCQPSSQSVPSFQFRSQWYFVVLYCQQWSCRHPHIA